VDAILRLLLVHVCFGSFCSKVASQQSIDDNQPDKDVISLLFRPPGSG
jgi:hypothetical protein